MKATKRVRRSVNLTPEIKAKLKRMAAESGLSKSGIIERLIRADLARMRAGN